MWRKKAKPLKLCNDYSEISNLMRSLINVNLWARYRDSFSVMVHPVFEKHYDVEL